MKIRSLYIPFYSIFFVLTIITVTRTIYYAYIKEPTLVVVRSEQAFNLNIKDSRFQYDKEGYRIFSDTNIVIPRLYSVFSLDGIYKDDFTNIYPPYILTKNQNSDTIWIFRQFYGDTLYIKLDTIDET